LILLIWQIRTNSVSFGSAHLLKKIVDWACMFSNWKHPMLLLN
jgi:hypothetical protein